MINKDLDYLKELYRRNSKHSNYQILPQKIQELLSISDDKTISRYEAERMEFIKGKVDFTDKTVLDIGGNTGFFSFEVLDSGAKNVTYIEGNASHCEFVKTAAELSDSRIKTYCKYLDFENDFNEEFFDVIFNLNVIHHLGDDFGNNNISKENAKQMMSDTFRYFENKCDTMIFQMGFCWKGDRYELLFKNGTKSEMIDFVKSALSDQWINSSIGIAELIAGETIYKDLSSSNLERDDRLGEFRNRPIFILTKRK